MALQRNTTNATLTSIATSTKDHCPGLLYWFGGLEMGLLMCSPVCTVFRVQNFIYMSCGAGVEPDQLQAEEQSGGPHRLHQHSHCLP